ncbi:MAG: hypothetical protein ACK5QT_01315 [Oligoflexia bacterium]|jgi:hypothetical protein
MAGNPKSALKLIARPEEFFFELIRDSLSRQKLKLAPEIEFYLVNLMNRFISTETLFFRDGEGQVREEPLALMLKDAMDQPHREAQKSLFQHVGDFSLYVAGYFQESFSRRSVDLDYFIGMGGAAYGAVASRETVSSRQKLYDELSQKFGQCVEVLADVSEKTTPKRETDLLRTYERWIRTGSEKAARALQEAGIMPTTQSRHSRKTIQ